MGSLSTQSTEGTLEGTNDLINSIHGNGNKLHRQRSVAHLKEIMGRAQARNEMFALKPT